MLATFSWVGLLVAFLSRSCLLDVYKVLFSMVSLVDDKHNIVGMITRKDVVAPALQEALANLNQAAALVGDGGPQPAPSQATMLQ